ncbi:MAG: glycosyltransferase family 2 protein [Deltaproteobacteria bacterium]|nr:glycosyltransferase family 2 protein [Deltaproteobacteria bacterium]
MNDNVPLSVAIITKNEEHNLPDCLISVAFARQIVVVDSGSTDNTAAIASAFGCEVYEEPWKGFGYQKQSAIDKCTSPWVLVLDADERIPPATSEVIKNIVSKDEGSAAGYRLPRKNWFQGRWIRHMGWWPDLITRLFRRELGRMSEDPVHESVIISGPIEDLDVPIEHYTDSDLGKILLKIDRYSTLGAEEAFRKGRHASVWSAFLRAVMTFYHNYFVRLGILDGVQGFTLSVTDSVNKFFKYAKLSDMNRLSKKEK